MKRPKKYLMFLLTLLLMFTTFSVNAKAASTSKTIKLNDSKVTMAVGQNKSIKLLNTTGSKKVTWTTNNNDVVSVKSAGRVTGRITAKKAGTATITAKFNGKTYNCKVTVRSTQLSDKTLKMTTGASQTIRLNYNVGNKKVTWKSSNTSVVTVKSAGRVTGRITAKKAGTATITATYGTETYKCKVTVVNAKLSTSSVSLKIGGSKEVKLNNVSGSDKVVWKSSNKSVATVTTTSRVRAKITAKKAGTATITATVYGRTFSFKVTVIGLNKTSLTLTYHKDTEKNMYEKVLCLNGAKPYADMWIDSNGKVIIDSKIIDWSSSDPTVVNIPYGVSDNYAPLEVKNPGTATITALWEGKTYKCTVTVKPEKGLMYLNKSSENIMVGKDKTLKLYGTNVSDKVEWKSSNSSIASVEGQGRTAAKVIAKKSGRTIITAKVAGKSYECIVNVAKPEISDRTIYLTPGISYDIWIDYVVARPDLRRISPSGYRENQKTFQNFDLVDITENVIWKSGNPAVVSVSKKNTDTATLVAKSTGTATITATVNGKNYKCKVEVIPYDKELVDLGWNIYCDCDFGTVDEQHEAWAFAMTFFKDTRLYPEISSNPIRKYTRITRLANPNESYRFYHTTSALYNKLKKEPAYSIESKSDGYGGVYSVFRR